jgi:hypothetical protein
MEQQENIRIENPVKSKASFSMGLLMQMTNEKFGFTRISYFDGAIIDQSDTYSIAVMHDLIVDLGTESRFEFGIEYPIDKLTPNLKHWFDNNLEDVNVD